MPAVPLIANAWIRAAQARRRVKRRLRPNPPRGELVRRYARGRSFVDVGTMWAVDGEIAFLAEESGATRVTAVDAMEETPGFRDKHERRGSSVRFVRGDVHHDETLEAVGVHDVVWCSGVIYHAPHPIQTLDCLRRITGDLLILGSQTIPEVPGLPQACVLYPGLDESGRSPYRAAFPHALAISEPFDPSNWYGNWWWGFTPSALRGMLATLDFEVVDSVEEPFDVYLVARRR